MSKSFWYSQMITLCKMIQFEHRNSLLHLSILNRRFQVSAMDTWPWPGFRYSQDCRLMPSGYQGTTIVFLVWQQVLFNLWTGTLKKATESCTLAARQKDEHQPYLFPLTATYKPCVAFSMLLPLQNHAFYPLANFVGIVRPPFPQPSLLLFYGCHWRTDGCFNEVFLPFGNLIGMHLELTGWISCIFLPLYASRATLALKPETTSCSPWA